MNEFSNNPCGNCTTNYGCCSLKGACGLMLTKEEYGKHFKGHAEKLVIRASRNFVIVSSRDGHFCPHLDANGCEIYHDRPIDCRLFPYMMNHVFENKWQVRIVFHDKSDCPKKNQLIQPSGEAKALAREFAQAVFGKDRPITVTFERRKTLVSRARNLVDKMLARL
ncbi:MAG: YkgJ family cysteine cluster protein [Desulfuromonadaceae bacterium]|nr:YkgJ family cysteine cluster protein [Desulfuromonadaceae bacterium]MDD5106913.1 YkgJ family cysteine cluster protein [Desulfuromonadaceae bacterium]